MRTNLTSISVVAVALLAFSALWSAPLPQAGSAGGAWSRSFRRGYFSLRGFEQDSLRPPLALWELYGGRRYDLTPWLQFQLAGEFGFGSNDFDTLYDVPLDDGSSRNQMAQTEELTVVGAAASMLYLLPAAEPFEPFLTIGAGLFWAHYREVGRADPGWSFLREAIGLPGASDGSVVRPDMRGGAGVAIRLNTTVSLRVEYLFRYWSPVACTFRHDMPLRGVGYWETFRTHQLRLGVDWKKRVF